jgi:Malate/L-lactate dehydrogenase
LAQSRALAQLTGFRSLARQPPCGRPSDADLPAWEGYSKIPPSVTGSPSRDRGPPSVWGCRAQVASIGTSPIAIGIPGPGPQDAPLVLDMATSVAAAGRIRQAAAEGKAIPEGIAIDAHGKPSFGLSWAALRSSSVFRN